MIIDDRVANNISDDITNMQKTIEDIPVGIRGIRYTKPGYKTPISLQSQLDWMIQRLDILKKYLDLGLETKNIEEE